jgi:hypothetical protein
MATKVKLPVIATVPVHEGPISAVSTRLVGIVRFARPLLLREINAGLFYQVTVDPEMISGEFIRFGQHSGDELVGWQRADFIRLCHVIAVAGDDGKLVNVSDTESRAIIETCLDKHFKRSQ